MKHSVIVAEDGRLVMAFSSEVTWLPLEKGDTVMWGEVECLVTKKVFYTEEDKMEYRVAVFDAVGVDYVPTT